MLWVSRCLVLPVALLGIAPSAAVAHVGGTISTSYKARITGFTAPERGVAAEVIGGDQDLRISVTPPHVVLVFGVLGEPFLRFSSAGVDANRASPTAASAHVIERAKAVRSFRPVWLRLSGGIAFTWHENRLRPRAVRGDAAPDGPVAVWRIPMLVDGGRTALAGTEWYRGAPSLGPWLVVSVLLVVCAVAAAAILPQRLCGRVAVGLTVVVVGAWTAGWDGILLDGRRSTMLVVVAVGWLAAAAALLAAVVAAARGGIRTAALAVVGAIVAAFSVPELPAFSRGFVLSALGDDAARASVVLSLAGGLALVILGIPAIVDVLRDDPLRRRLWGNDEVGL
jgi:hypothetical protein